MGTLVNCQDLSKKIESKPVLNSITFSVNEGELFFLLGPSGCGKTTLLRIISGLIQQDSGKLEIAGQDMENIVPEQRGIGFVFQNYALWPHLNVRQHVEFGLKNLKSKVDLPSRTNEVLNLLQISDLAERFPHELSGGQQQRVSLARALAPHPKILLLDEPLSNLDPRLREEMRQELRKVQRELGLTFIYVTHDRTEALAMGDRIALINQGKIVQIGKPLDLYFRPNSEFVAKFLGETNLIDGHFQLDKNGSLVLSSELGFIAVPSDYVAKKKRVRFSLRPEDLKIKNEIGSADDERRVQATITEIIPSGVISYVRVVLDNGRELVASISMRRSLDFEAGMKVSLVSSWPRIWILENECAK